MRPRRAEMRIWIGFLVAIAIIGAACMPPAFLAISKLQGWPLADHYPLLGLTLLLATAVVIRHRTNIGRLLAGTESRLGDAKPAE